jgi:hypothetical protein
MLNILPAATTSIPDSVLNGKQPRSNKTGDSWDGEDAEHAKDAENAEDIEDDEDAADDEDASDASDTILELYALLNTTQIVLNT